MGNSAGKLCCCFTAASGGVGGGGRGRQVCAAVVSDPSDESLGHSFCYVPPAAAAVEDSDDTLPTSAAAMFRSISGAAFSANASTPPLSTSAQLSELTWPPAAAFESSGSFTSAPLQPIPRFPSGPLSGPIPEHGFLSGPLDRGFLSGPLDPHGFSAPLDAPAPRRRRRRLRLRSSSAASFLLRLSARSKEPTTTPGPSAADVQWAQGKAGEDRVHVVVSEDHGWVFVGIYDGFNGPDATDYLLSNLYPAVRSELKGLLWEDHREIKKPPTKKPGRRSNTEKQRSYSRSHCHNIGDVELFELARIPKPKRAVNKEQVLKALSEALRKTEEGYLNNADNMVGENPELALMGSCVLAMLLKEDDMYLINVGDSRAVLAHEPGMLEAGSDREEIDRFTKLAALQLTLDHSTSDEKEVYRIRNEHPDDVSAIVNDRVKGSLKVTRAFGAGFLKQPKWNDALLEMFRIDYIGTSPYITCSPSLCHHKLSSNDKFLILSSDGLYQYFTNEDVVAQVEMFIEASPEGDPAQHLIEEVLFRAAEKAGMDFHELLEIPHGERRRYHDDVSIIVISLEGRIWRSSV